MAGTGSDRDRDVPVAYRVKETAVSGNSSASGSPIATVNPCPNELVREFQPLPRPTGTPLSILVCGLAEAAGKSSVRHPFGLAAGPDAGRYPKAEDGVDVRRGRPGVGGVPCEALARQLQCPPFKSLDR